MSHGKRSPAGPTRGRCRPGSRPPSRAHPHPASPEAPFRTPSIHLDPEHALGTSRALALGLRELHPALRLELVQPREDSAEAVARLRLAPRRHLDRAADPRLARGELDILDPAPRDE